MNWAYFDFYREMPSYSAAKYKEFLQRQMATTIKKDLDIVSLYIGDVGTGKSNSAQHDCSVVDPNYDPKVQTVYEPEEFDDLTVDLEPGRAITIDEGKFSGNKKRSKK